MELVQLEDLSTMRRFKAGEQATVVCVNGHESAMPTVILNAWLERRSTSGKLQRSGKRVQHVGNSITPGVGWLMAGRSRRAIDRFEQTDMQVDATMHCLHCSEAIVGVLLESRRGVKRRRSGTAASAAVGADRTSGDNDEVLKEVMLLGFVWWGVTFLVVRIAADGLRYATLLALVAAWAVASALSMAWGRWREARARVDLEGVEWVMPVVGLIFLAVVTFNTFTGNDDETVDEVPAVAADAGDVDEEPDSAEDTDLAVADEPEPEPAPVRPQSAEEVAQDCDRLICEAVYIKKVKENTSVFDGQSAGTTLNFGYSVCELLAVDSPQAAANALTIMAQSYNVTLSSREAAFIVDRAGLLLC